MVLGQPVFQAISCPDELESIFRMLGAPSEDTWPGVTELCTHLQSYAKFKLMGIVHSLESLLENVISLAQDHVDKHWEEWTGGDSN
ncbi:hypothetical protein SESBI_02533 [Sesbania bispinosa]|nr:hypothetical protein SESBI_02533 [Sesbania bispinosa]